MTVSADDLRGISETARDLAYRQLDSQLQASDNFDAKAVGVLGFDGAALAAILAATSLFSSGRWAVPALLLVISGGLAIFTLGRSGWDLGPDPRAFYDDEIGRGATVGSAARANVDLVSELGGSHGSISRNEVVLRRKAWFLAGAIGAAVLAGIFGAILIAVPK